MMEVGSSVRSKNGRVAVSADGQIPEALLRLLFGEQPDGAADAADGGDHAGRYHALLQRAVCAASMGGSYVAVAHAERFMLLGRPEGSSTCYRLVSVGGDAALPGETVTALYCMDIYAPAPAQQARPGSPPLCVVAGYSTGHVRVFSAYGRLLMAHQLHPQPVLRIRLRMPLQDQRAAPAQPAAPDDVEEMCLTYADGTMVCVNGQSLYLALRLCLNEALAGEADAPALQYKKWAFDLGVSSVADAVSYGPAAGADPLALLAKGAATSDPLPPDATARFLVAPRHGEAAFGVFMTSEDAATSFSAAAIAGKVAAKVTGAVLSIAMSYFWRGGDGGGGGGDGSGAEAAGPGGAHRTEQGTPVPCVFAVRDSPRKVLDISLAPAQRGLAALTDSLGRVLLFDLESCEVVHMLKGLRGSQCAWLETQHGVYVVVCAAARGVVEVYELAQMERPLASVNVGPGWALHQCPAQPLGGSLLVGPGGSERRAALPLLASCMLLNSRGQTAQISIVL
ncbi:hypothetical protein H4R18_004856 [Coemansia javaensis]|uniref:Rab3-GAP regulatory subunit N-terminal domain-containing protein n=1 Tax=Coemansia javaensis TaxID=2761396 RepID=A0A9W8H882_9FUNG|nr:hypothetical protein H4R18_004856 [Coemansia javaensis]